MSTASGEARWTEAALSSAIAAAQSWRGVLRILGEKPSSASLARRARSLADQLELDTTHLRGNRTWTDVALRDAISTSADWAEVLDRLGLAAGSRERIRAHAKRTGVPVDHLDPAPGISTERPGIEHLPRAAPLLAAAWFTICGSQVSWPLEPCRYDLLVDGRDGCQRVQVKTSTRRDGRSWIVWLSTTSPRRRAYAAEDVDSFFIVDGDLVGYLIPQSVVEGRQAICLSAYERFRLPGFAALVSAIAPPATPP